MREVTLQTIVNRTRISSMDSTNIANGRRGSRDSFVTSVTENGEVYLRLPREVLRSLGVGAVRVVEGLDRKCVGRLLVALASESDVGHTWRRIIGGKDVDAGGLVDAVEAQLAKGRPTTCYTYVGERQSGDKVAVGFAAISEKVSVDFPFSGYPVLARAFINPKLRGLGLYRHIVAHRVEVCELRWGVDLMAIHMGAATPPVVSLQRSRVGYMEPFVQIGHEILDLGVQSIEVSDLLAVSPRFMAELTESLGDNIALCNGIVGWLKGGDGAWSWGRVSQEIGLSVELGETHELPVRLEQLVALVEAIGVVGER